MRRLQRQHFPALRRALFAAPFGWQEPDPIRRGSEGTELLQFPTLEGDRRLDRVLREAQLRKRPGDRVHPGGGVSGGCRRRRRRPRAGRHSRCRRTAHRVHRVQDDAVADGRGPQDRADGGGVLRRGNRAAYAVLLRAGRRNTVRPRRPAVRGGPNLRRAAGGGGVRVRVASASDEVGHRQRRRPHQGAHVGSEPGTPGPDHPGNQRNRRWRQCAGPGETLAR